MTKSRNIRPPRKPWTAEQLDILRREYPNTLTRDLVARIGHPERSIHGKAQQLGVRKSAEWMSGPLAQRLDGHRGHGTTFKPGHKPWSTGTKGLAGVHPSSRTTQFKKGELRGRNASTFIPVGGTRVDGEGYLDRKVRTDGPPQDRFERVHRLVWIEANGPIPENHVVIFRPGMKTTVLEEITVERLECISRRELVQRNRLPPELMRIQQLRGQLTRAINDREKERS